MNVRQKIKGVDCMNGVRRIFGRVGLIIIFSLLIAACIVAVIANRAKVGASHETKPRIIKYYDGTF